MNRNGRLSVLDRVEYGTRTSHWSASVRPTRRRAVDPHSVCYFDKLIWFVYDLRLCCSSCQGPQRNEAA